MPVSFNHEEDFYQPRDFGQKIAATFDFIGTHASGLGRALLLLVVPAALAQGIARYLFSIVLNDNIARGMAGSYGNGFQYTFWRSMSVSLTSPQYWVSLLFTALFISLMILTVYGYLLHCLRGTTPGQPVPIPLVWAVVKRYFLRTFLTYVAVYLMLVVGFFVFIVPGLYLLVALSLVYVVQVVEDCRFSESLSRSMRLINNNWWPTLGLLLMLLMLIGVVYLIMSSVLTFGWRWVLLLLHVDLGSAYVSGYLIISTLIGQLVVVLFLPPLLLALAFQYFNLVEQQEGRGLRHLLDQLGQAAPSVQSQAYRPDEEGEY